MTAASVQFTRSKFSISVQVFVVFQYMTYLSRGEAQSTQQLCCCRAGHKRGVKGRRCLLVLVTPAAPLVTPAQSSFSQNLVSLDA